MNYHCGKERPTALCQCLFSWWRSSCQPSPVERDSPWLISLSWAGLGGTALVSILHRNSPVKVQRVEYNDNSLKWPRLSNSLPHEAASIEQLHISAVRARNLARQQRRKNEKARLQQLMSGSSLDCWQPIIFFQPNVNGVVS